MLKHLYILSLVVITNCSIAQITFNRTYDTDSLQDINFTVTQASNGDYLVVASLTGSVSGAWETQIMRFDSIGDTLWTRRYDFSPTGVEAAHEVFELDSGLFIAGSEYQDSVTLKRDYFLFKFDGAGNILWTGQYGNPFQDYLAGFQLCSDGGFIIVGNSADSLLTFTTGSLVRIDSSGNELWNKTYKSGIYNFNLYDVEQTSDGGFMAVGQVYLPGNERSSCIMKIDVAGDTVWTRYYNATNNSNDGFGRLQLLNDGGAVVSGAINYNATYFSGYVVRMDSTGNILWSTVIPNGNYNSSLYDMVLSDNIYCLGYKYNLNVSQPRRGGWLTKIDIITGDTLWNQLYTHDTLCDNELVSIYKASEGFIMSGHSSIGCNYDVWLVKVDSNGCDIPGCIPVSVESLNKNRFSIYPNPVNDVVTIKNIGTDRLNKISIRNQLSEMIYSSPANNEENLTINVSTLPDGMYYLILTLDSGHVQVNKLLILH